MELMLLFGQGDLVCLGLRGEGMFQGQPFFGSATTGRREVNFSLDVLEFRGDKIAKDTGYWDFSVFTGRAAPLAGGHHDPSIFCIDR
jgi:hypothetical protein